MLKPLLPLLVLATALHGLSAAPPRKELRPGMRFVQVPATDDHPPYWVQQTEVTRASWRAVMNTEPWKTHDTFFRPGDTIPAAFITWNDVQEFIRKLNASDFDYVYRLPTEAEWEEACRAGKNAEPDDLGPVAWYDANAFLTSTDKFTHTVALKAPNAWGLHDCLGNVWEWVQDSGDKGEDRIIKGGSWRTNKATTRSTARNWLSATQFAGDLGFRLVATPVEDGLWSEWAPLHFGNYQLSWRTRWVSSGSKGQSTWLLNLKNDTEQSVEALFQWGLGSMVRNETITFEAGRIREVTATWTITEKGQQPTVTLVSCQPAP